jgi:hypothetical protein
MRLSCRAQGHDKMGHPTLYNARLLMDYENNRIEVLTGCALDSTWPTQNSYFSDRLGYIYKTTF